ncbi:FHA domain-containing protein [Paenarthrobacter sp. CM16]|nr:FHA domain-containing protein [Paenarthrobacter sp. CM16]
MTSAAVNRKYTALMRASGVVGPSGLKQPRKHIVVLTPSEDYGFIKSFGIVAYERQLLDYLRRYAAEEGWSRSDVASVHFTLDCNRKRLRPSLAVAGVDEQRTSVLTPHSPAEPRGAGLPGEVTLTATEAAGPFQAASLEYEGALTPLPMDIGEVTIGRGEDNFVVIGHKNFSTRHLILWPHDGHWFAKTAGGKNATYLNGQRLTGPARLNDGDVLLVGASNPVTFRSQSF